MYSSISKGNVVAIADSLLSICKLGSVRLSMGGRSGGQKVDWERVGEDFPLAFMA